MLALLIGAEVTARLDDLARMDVPISAVLNSGYDLTVRDDLTLRGRPFGRHKMVRLNAGGFRGPPLAPEPPAGCVRVVVLGASEAAGPKNRARKDFPAQLHDSLQPHGCFEVHNAALGGQNITQITLLWTSWVAQWAPDIVVVYPTPNFYLGNEAPTYPSGYRPPVKAPAWWQPRLFDRLSSPPSVLPRWVTIRRLRRSHARTVSEHEPGWQYTAVPPDRLALFEQHLDSLVRDIHARGAEPVLMTHATRFPEPPGAEDELLMLEWSQGTRAAPRVQLDFEQAGRRSLLELGRRRNVMVVDLAGRMTGHREWFTDYSHFTDEGAGVVAQLLRDSVVALAGRLARDPLPPDSARQASATEPSVPRRPGGRRLGARTRRGHPVRRRPRTGARPACS